MKIRLHAFLSQQSVMLSRKSVRPQQIIQQHQLILLQALHPLSLMQGQSVTDLDSGEVVLAVGPLDLAPHATLALRFRAMICEVQDAESAEQGWVAPITEAAARCRAERLLAGPIHSEQELAAAERGLLRFLASCPLDPRREVARRPREAMEQRVASVYHYMLTHCDKPLTLHDLSHLAGCHPVYLSTMYSRVYRVSPMQHLQQIRMGKARVLVRSTTMKIKDIALSLGHVSSSQFGSIYKRYYGVSPNRDRVAARMKLDRRDKEERG
ncbi:hypothetical protein PA598K_02661 [Paenibacillus sp. 598K]|uniref:helix-turn-helix transcriptional regulator n=1 Tax=Paenibacillus sp. 598K TaxID=1117987 RepID=UPI000FF9C15D|nr:AraC family transcriptional regulator [Paenibacillus sp. 598K]GBF74323.1 hypothetical protein PA598K_02661 [Paenibacillus sp. 598K]